MHLSNAAFKIVFPETVEKHFHLWILYSFHFNIVNLTFLLSSAMFASQVWWVHLTIVYRLVGHKLSGAKLIQAPLLIPISLYLLSFLVSPTFALTWVARFALLLLLLLFLKIEGLIFFFLRIGFSLYFGWWCLVVYNLSKGLGSPIFTVPEVKKE